jgi:hypothetical protein
VASLAPFLAICQNSALNYHELPRSRYNVPKKMGFYKVVAFRVKTNPQTLAAPRLFQRYATKKILFGFQIVAKSARSLEPVFTSMGALLNGP